MDAAHSGQYGQERIQEVMNKLIFQAGVDYEYVPLLLHERTRLTHPLPCAEHALCTWRLSPSVLKYECPWCRIVMCASAMPDPREVSYDLLLV